MNFSGTKCDECGRIKGESNHWHQIGVTQELGAGGRLSLLLGLLAHDVDEVHDLCGEACFYKHIGKLLKINPSRAPEDEAVL